MKASNLQIESYRQQVLENCFPTISNPDGVPGVYVPLNWSECKFARFCTDSDYSWEQAINDLCNNDGFADELYDGCIDELLTVPTYKAVEAAKKIGDATLDKSTIELVRTELLNCSIEVQNAAVKSVGFLPASPKVIRCLLADYQLSDTEVAELKKLAEYL